MRVSSLQLALALALVATASLAAAQSYEQQYGPPIDVTLDDLTFNPEIYDERVVRTKGRLDMLRSVGGRAYAISQGVGATVLISPMRELQGRFEQQARDMTGETVEITGLFRFDGGRQHEPVRRLPTARHHLLLGHPRPP